MHRQGQLGHFAHERIPVRGSSKSPLKNLKIQIHSHVRRFLPSPPCWVPTHHSLNTPVTLYHVSPNSIIWHVCGHDKLFVETAQRRCCRGVRVIQRLQGAASLGHGDSLASSHVIIVPLPSIVSELLSLSLSLSLASAFLFLSWRQCVCAQISSSCVCAQISSFYFNKVKFLYCEYHTFYLNLDSDWWGLASGLFS